MADIIEGTERCLYVVPPPLVVETAANELRDERAPTPSADASVEVRDQRVVQRYVQSHVLTIAHAVRWWAAVICGA